MKKRDINPDERYRTKHESYGMISCSRVNGSNHTLFGSSIQHNNFIEIQLSTAAVDRHLDQDWHYTDEHIITVQLSPVQFSDMITNMNTQGVPCTIYSQGAEYKEPCPKRGVRELHEQEFATDIKNILGNVTKMMKMVEGKLKATGPIKKSEREELASILYKVEQAITSNLPFAHKQFNRQVNRTILEAKSEVEAFFLSTIHKLGSDELKKKLDEGSIIPPQIIMEADDT